MARTYAYCYASGLICFGKKVPRGALAIARGQDKPLRNMIDGVARHGYRSRTIKGRLTKVPGTEHLLVPGVPDAELLGRDPLDALEQFIGWIASHAPRNVAVLTRDHPGRREV